MIFRTTLFISLASIATAASPQKPQNLFNGKDLKGWSGLPANWSVQDGAITAENFESNKIKQNTFLVWDKELPDHYEVSFKYKILSKWANSGLQFHSKLLNDKTFSVGGLQADFESGNKFSGILYEERGRGILAQRGSRVIVQGNEKSKVSSFVVPERFDKNETNDGWQTYKVVFYKQRALMIINGYLTADVAIKDFKKNVAGKSLAFQLHVGPPSKLQFKDIRLTELKLGNAASDKKYFVSLAQKIKNADKLSPTIKAVKKKAASTFLTNDYFELPDDLEITRWAQSPQLMNPTNMDIDSKGRIWVTEGMNYRRSHLRDKGDRIVVLSDTNNDGTTLNRKLV